MAVLKYDTTTDERVLAASSQVNVWAIFKKNHNSLKIQTQFAVNEKLSISLVDASDKAYALCTVRQLAFDDEIFAAH